MTITLVAATPFEIAPLTQWLGQHYIAKGDGIFVRGNTRVQVLVTGVGLMATAWRLGYHFAGHQTDLAINAGIAGAFDRSLSLGDVVNVRSECLGDLGVEEADGRVTDFFQLGMIEADQYPFSKGLLQNPNIASASFLPAVQGISVQKVHGFAPSIEAVQTRYPDVQVESMEGAAFFYACLMAQIPFLEIRSISNFVEPRNREAWDIPLAINRLNQVLTEMLIIFNG